MNSRNFGTQGVRLPHPLDDYIVEPSGRVYSEKSGIYLQSFPDRHGYLIVRLYDKKGNQIQRNVARLVANNFMPNRRPNARTLIYKNYDRTDCSIGNLKLVTRVYANRYAEQYQERDRYNTPDMSVRVKVEGDIFLPRPVGTIAEAAEEFGLLYHDIEMSARDKTPCLSAPMYTFFWEYTESPHYF